MVRLTVLCSKLYSPAVRGHSACSPHGLGGTCMAPSCAAGQPLKWRAAADARPGQARQVHCRSEGVNPSFRNPFQFPFNEFSRAPCTWCIHNNSLQYKSCTDSWTASSSWTSWWLIPPTCDLATAGCVAVTGCNGLHLVLPAFHASTNTTAHSFYEYSS